MLVSLRRDGELTARQLADVAGVAPQTASGHLAKLAAAGLVSLRKRGRYHCYSLGSAHVGDLLDAIHIAGSTLALGGEPMAPAKGIARLCHGHLAGPLAAAIARALLDHCPQRGWVVRERGRELLTRWGISARLVSWERCHDHADRREHIGGQLGAAILDHALALGWIRRPAGDEIVVTPGGWRGFEHRFAIGPDLATVSVARGSGDARSDPRPLVRKAANG